MYIEREALLQELEIAFEKEGKKADECAVQNLPDCSIKYGHGQYCYLVAKTMVQDQPTADVVEVRHGEWIVEEEQKTTLSGSCVYKAKTYHCPYCKKHFKQRMNFCGECGAKMKGKGESK